MDKKRKINIFDTLAVLVLIGVILLAVLAAYYKPSVTGSKVLLTVKTLTPDAAVIQEVAGSQKEVFFNSVNIAVKVISVQPDGQSLLVTLEAPGQVAQNKDIFNGQRVQVGQKAEIHGNYFAQGLITEVKNEN